MSDEVQVFLTPQVALDQEYTELALSRQNLQLRIGSTHRGAVGKFAMGEQQLLRIIAVKLIKILLRTLEPP